MQQNITEKDILDSADPLAEAATTFRGHGCPAFIAAREAFIELLHKFTQEREQPAYLPWLHYRWSLHNSVL